MTRDDAPLATSELEKSAGLRRAALLLHAVAAKDRKWLLEGLGAAAEVALSPLLLEVKQLALPVPPDFIDDVLRRRAPIAASPKPPESAPLVAGDLLACLRDEPDALVARALQCVASPVRRTVLRRLPAPRRARVLELLARQGAEPVRLAAALSTALARCATSTPTVLASRTRPVAAALARARAAAERLGQRGRQFLGAAR